MPKFYITTAIDYSNGEPHLGHAVEKIGADVIARYRRACGDEVHFLIGMDEHGQKVEQEALKEGSPPQVWVDRVGAQFQDAWARLDVSNDDFIRTSEERHRSGVKALMERIAAKGDFYQSRYEGHYCAGCEAFKKDDELDDSGQCRIHPTRSIEWTEEENWFFRLSNYGEDLLRYYEANPDFIRPPSRRNEVVNFVESGLEDISASRSRLSWGIPFPGDEQHTVYVWFDALSNYITALGYPDGAAFQTLWPADLHVIGKDITRFHCVFWPAMLLAAGVDLPKAVWGHGFINVGGAKLSKSGGSELDLVQLIDRHGADALRYFLIREVPWDGDRNFASVDDFVEQFDRRYTSDLANDLGNLLNRVVSMVVKYRDGAVPGTGAGPVTGGRALTSLAEGAVQAYRGYLDDYRLHHGLATVLDLVAEANGFVDQSKPWALAKTEADGGERGPLDDVLEQLIQTLGSIAVMLSPFTPSKAAEMWGILGGDGPVPGLNDVPEALGTLKSVRPGAVLFPRPEE